MATATLKSLADGYIETIENIAEIDRFFELLPFAQVGDNDKYRNREVLDSPDDRLVRFYSGDMKPVTSTIQVHAKLSKIIGDAEVC